MKLILKKILSYTAVAFLGFATGVGCLIGVSSCSQQQASGDHQENKQQLKVEKKYKKIELDVEDFDSENVYYFVAKNYSQNGKGVFYQDSISLENSAITSNTTAYLYSNEISFTLIRQEGYVASRLGFTNSQSAGVYHLNNVYLRDEIVNRTYVIYSASQGEFNNLNCAFVGTKFSSGSYNNSIYFVNTFFDVYLVSSSDEIFTFNDFFNYNMFLQPNDTFTQRALFPVSNLPISLPSSYPEYFELKVPWFYSNGLVFDTIRAYWLADLGYNFEQADGTFRTFDQPAVGHYNAYFTKMTYYNSATQYESPVCARPSYVVGTGYSASHIFYKPIWVDDDFKELVFLDDVRNIRTKNILNSVNNGVEGFTIKNDIDVGLANVFELLSLAFTAWTPIFAIQIVPGITIGLLLFLPLIAGIIILIIWIVKR